MIPGFENIKGSKESKWYGYARCSTNADRQDINRQIRELKKLGVTNEKNIYFEYVSGASTKKVELDKLLSLVKEGDVIVATEPSRISRSTLQLCELIEFAKQRRIKLILGKSFTVDCTTGRLDAMTNAFIQISAVFAELEKNLISERVKSGLQNAREKGKKLGRPTLDIEDVTGDTKFMRAYNLYKEGKLKKIDIHQMTGYSRVTIDKYIKMLEEE